MNCGNCKFSDGDEHGLWCQRFPPQLVVVPVWDDSIRLERPAIEGHSTISHFPQVKSDDWCGEYKGKMDLRERLS